MFPFEQMKRSFLVVLLCITPGLPLITCPTRAEEHEDLSINLELKSRSEYWNTFLEFPAYDNPYGFVMIRGRTSVRYTYSILEVHGAMQGSMMLNLPDNAFIGPGRDYFEAAKDKNPHSFSINQANVCLRIRSLNLRIGRMPIRDGAEVIYEKDGKFNFLKEKSITERLVGSFDWSSVGRSFDGASGMIDVSNTRLWIFTVRALSGVDSMDSPHLPMKIVIGGGSITLKKEKLRNTELRLFNIIYDDRRESTLMLLNSPVSLNAFGASVLSVQKMRFGELDFVAWGAYQFGKYGKMKHNSASLVLEAGYELSDVTLRPWLRIGTAWASGDDRDDDINRRFFNLIPANHKYYGNLDLFALSNILDNYLQAIVSYDMLRIELHFHTFRLASPSDKWVYGSGASNRVKLGYSEIDLTESHVGNEIDTLVSIQITDWLSFLGGYSVFFGSTELKKLFKQKSNASWIFSQLRLSI